MNMKTLLFTGLVACFSLSALADTPRDKTLNMEVEGYMDNYHRSIMIHEANELCLEPGVANVVITTSKVDTSPGAMDEQQMNVKVECPPLDPNLTR